MYIASTYFHCRLDFPCITELTGVQFVMIFVLYCSVMVSYHVAEHACVFVPTVLMAALPVCISPV